MADGGIKTSSLNKFKIAETDVKQNKTKQKAAKQMKATTKHVLNDTTVSVKSTKQKYKLMEDIEGQEQRNIN